MSRTAVGDGTELHHEERGAGRPLVMLHGWTFSGRFFHRNAERLADHARVVTIDLRGHGESDKPGHGYRVGRLAKDVYDVLEALDLTDVTLLGWSLGCPVIWSYLELFGAHRLAQAVFVEQTPRQYYGPDWSYAHATCYDDAGLARTQTQIELAAEDYDRQQIDTIVHRPLPDDERRLLLAEMAKCPPRVRNAVMADHTRLDWRDLLPTIALPSLVLVARRDAVMPWQGPAHVGRAIPGARTVFFEESGHALFLDEPDRFDETVADFLREGGSR
ncbi:alpha/beta fold hydrolase [Thermomonospora umbrina]|uniref:Pimeloyl-ACP methyl ester carboxylesterase n=1 Tax=Thermomonospora umbrina TaxID=111806 RepID=A0A3D9SVN1_9ACTN|nr:alpha/beta hydrolase [Thermomonospora umbrina]REE99868.1 pimeloyl-ACP methyl ester carboxylesterase [Thermomonospora umbrina]